MIDTKRNSTAAALTLATHDSSDELPTDIKEFLLANRAKVMSFFKDMLDPDKNAAWQKGFEAFDLSDDFKATARVMFEEAVDAKVEAEVERIVEAIEDQVAELIQERDQLLGYIERECPLDESLDEAAHQTGNPLNETQMAKYVDAIRRTSWIS